MVIKSIIQIIIAVLLIAAILLQMQGSGISRTFGGGGEFYRSKQSIEKLLVWVTIILSVSFGLITLLFSPR
ncbi:MAG: preprotein translocase subunit SecG [Patescibacteria group bacterium]|nr:preprotein translocase subunit SecG [Patescibacteria group bacterium]